MWIKQAERITDVDKMIIATSLAKETLQFWTEPKICFQASIEIAKRRFSLVFSCLKKFPCLRVKIYFAHYDSPSNFKKSGLNRKHRAKGKPDRTERRGSIGIKIR